ncbi:hypothetical protein T492DRAFT_880320 [Pavlovales sp. CCMP2436]|nr:hypothetical protein T492DRAFT_880320 [Pavlovales sp. CCMP2436]
MADRGGRARRRELLLAVLTSWATCGASELATGEADAAQALTASYSRGALAFNEGAYAEAAANFQRAVELARALDGQPPATPATVQALEQVLAKALASAGAAESAPSNPIQYGGPAPAGLAVHSGLTQEREAGSESRLESRLDSDRAALRETPDDPFAHLTYGMYAFGEQRAHTAAAWAFQRGAELAPDLPFVVFGMPYLLMHALQHRCDFAAVDVWEPKLQLAMEAAINCILKQECGPNEEYR